MKKSSVRWLTITVITLIVSWMVCRGTVWAAPVLVGDSPSSSTSTSNSTPGSAPGSSNGAAIDPKSLGPTTPVSVAVGIYVNQVHELSIKDNQFTVDFYVWFRFTDDTLKPWESFAIGDGRIESKGEVTKKKIGDLTYAYMRVVAKITKFWKIANYPLDSHDLTIIVEEEQGEDHLIRYTADVENSAVDPRVTLPGWVVAGLKVEPAIATYRTNFGDLSLPTGKESRYSKLVSTIRIERKSASYFLKVFFGLWVSAAIAFLCFFIKPTNVDPRFGLGVGAIFAAVASEWSVTSILPDTGIITLAEKLHIVAFGFILFAITQSTISLWMFENEREPLSKRFDRACAIWVPVLYAVTNTVVVLLRPA